MNWENMAQVNHIRAGQVVTQKLNMRAGSEDEMSVEMSPFKINR